MVADAESQADKQSIVVAKGGRLSSLCTRAGVNPYPGTLDRDGHIAQNHPGSPVEVNQHAIQSHVRNVPVGVRQSDLG
jgi:hypothetical protein